MRIYGVILAGGQGRRMGGTDKGALMLGGESLLARAEARLAPQVEALAVNANTPVQTTLPLLRDEIEDTGPLAGVLAGLDWAAKGGASHLVSVAVDTPFFPGDLVPRLLWAAETGGQPIAVAASGGRRHPVFGLWPVGLRDALRADLAAGVRRIGGWAADRGAAEADFPATPLDPFTNINTPDDLTRAEALLKGAG